MQTNYHNAQVFKALNDIQFYRGHFISPYDNKESGTQLIQ